MQSGLNGSARKEKPGNNWEEEESGGGRGEDVGEEGLWGWWVWAGLTGKSEECRRRNPAAFDPRERQF